MTGMVRKALTIAAGFAVVASVASAGVPDPRFSTVDAVVVGTNSGVLTQQPGDPTNPGFDVVVRDVNNAPLSGRTVTLNYSASGMKVYSTQDAGTTVNCGAKSISRVTNGSGVATFGARTGKFNNANTVEVSADGVVLANVKGRSTDIDGLPEGKTGLNDLSLFSVSYLGAGATETDYDVTGTGNGLGDLSTFANEYLLGPTLLFCP